MTTALVCPLCEASITVTDGRIEAHEVRPSVGRVFTCATSGGRWDHLQRAEADAKGDDVFGRISRNNDPDGFWEKVRS